MYPALDFPATWTLNKAAPQSKGGFHAPEEGLDRQALEALQIEKLRGLLGQVLPRNGFQAAKLARAGIAAGEISSIRSLEDLRRLPFTTKAEVQADQEAHPPFGSNLTHPLERYVRLHQTSGTSGQPIRWLDTAESWGSLVRAWGSIYTAAGIRPPDRVVVASSFGPFLGFWAAFEGATALGMLALPAGGMTSAARLRFLRETEATVLVCTPTYALRLLEVAREEGHDLTRGPVRSLMVAGEPGGSIPAVRERIETGWGARCFDHWGMTEVGPLGFEAVQAPGEMLLLETECIAEVVDPLTGAPAKAGERGELCITTLGRAASPLLRYRTGDLVTYASGRSSSGRSFLKLTGGILGRIDDMILVRGNNVYPSAIDAVLRRFGRIVEYRVVVLHGRGASSDLRLVIEPDGGADGARLAEEVRRAVQEALCFRPEVEVAPPGTLPRFEMKAKRIIHDQECIA